MNTSYLDGVQFNSLLTNSYQSCRNFFLCFLLLRFRRRSWSQQIRIKSDWGSQSMCVVLQGTLSSSAAESDYLGDLRIFISNALLLKLQPYQIELGNYLVPNAWTIQSKTNNSDNFYYNTINSFFCGWKLMWILDKWFLASFFWF